jgi:hypothetical protein
LCLKILFHVHVSLQDIHRKKYLPTALVEKIMVPRSQEPECIDKDRMISESCNFIRIKNTV